MNLPRRSWALFALALTFVLAACSTPADLAPPLEPQFGTSDKDTGLDLKVDSSGRVFVLSETTEGEYNSHAQVRRFDNTGKTIWTKDVYSAAGCYADDRIDKLEADARGNVYLGYVYYGCEYQPRLVEKYDSSGRYLYTLELDSDASYDFTFSVDASGYIYKVADGLLEKYSPGGAYLWSAVTDVETLDQLPALQVASNGYVFVAGPNGVSRYTSGGTLSWTKSFAWSKPELGFDVAASGSNVYVRNLTTIRKLDASGRQLWTKTQSGLTGLLVNDMTADASGNIYLTGKYSASSTNRNAFVRKLNSSGGLLWTKTYGTAAYDDGMAIATVNGSDIYVTGQTQGNLTGSYKGGEGDGYLRRLNSSGNPYWTR